MVVRRLGQKHMDAYLKGAPEVVASLCKVHTGEGWWGGNLLWDLGLLKQSVGLPRSSECSVKVFADQICVWDPDS